MFLNGGLVLSGTLTADQRLKRLRDLRAMPSLLAQRYAGWGDLLTEIAWSPFSMFESNSHKLCPEAIGDEDALR
jgi:hypothetical protein